MATTDLNLVTDVLVQRDADGAVFAFVPSTQRPYHINAQPVDWNGTWAEWALLDLSEQAGDHALDLSAQESAYQQFADLPYQGSILDAVGFNVGDPPLTELFLTLTEYLFLADIDYVLATLAAAVAKVLPADPLWLMLVSPSSSGKGEALRLLGGVRDVLINDLTLAGLLGKGNTGVLADMQGRDALAVISDFSSLLDDPRTSGAMKIAVFNALRDIYDGEYHRDIHPARLSWSGRLSLVAACTPAVDRFSVHADALGTRWLYFRQADHDVETRRAMAQTAYQREGLPQKRTAARALATDIIAAARERVHGVALPGAFNDLIVDAAVLVGSGRAVVPRDWHGEIDDVVVPEDPGRVTGQLTKLACGLLALGVREDVARRIVHRAALSTIPQARTKVLGVLSAAEGAAVSTTSVQRAAGLDWRPAKRALEDWRAVGFVLSEREENSVSTDPTTWRLAPEHAVFIRSAATAVIDTQEGR